jgi:hypothetical protein
MDDISALLRQLLKVFGSTHPIRVGIGICLGFLIKIVWVLGVAYFPTSVLFKELNNLPVFYNCIVLVGLLMIPAAFGRRGAPEDASLQIRTIEALLDAGNFSSSHRRLIWHSLVQKYLEAVRPNLDKPLNIDLVEEARDTITAQSAEAND